jgi:hypothetical protein
MKRETMKQVRLNEIELLKLKAISKKYKLSSSVMIRVLIENEFNKQREDRKNEADKQLKSGTYNIEGLETLEITNLVEDLSNSYKLLIDRFNNEIRRINNE